MENAKLRKPGLRDWGKLYGLYRSAFPAAERKPWWMILCMYHRGKTDIWCIEQAGRFAGLAITINGPDLILLDYFAVASGSRGQGIGKGALTRLKDLYGDKGFFLEIESTRESAPNLSQRLRRKAFYLRCGLVELGTTAKLFGVNMELLGVRCAMDYDRYKDFYRENYNQWAADHIEKC